LNLVRELDHAVHLRLCLLPIFYEARKVCIDGVCSTQEVVHLKFLERKTRFDRLFTSPILAMCLALDENLQVNVRCSNDSCESVSEETYGLVVDIAIPTQPDGFSSFSLFQTAKIKFKILIVEVDGSYSCIKCEERKMRIMEKSDLRPLVQILFQH
jgi:hypothetical protein